MSLKVFDYECPSCGAVREGVLVDGAEEVHCINSNCNADEPTVMTKLMSAPNTFSKIIPTYPGSQRRKAGYQHKHVNRPATKTQVGVGGGVTKGDD